MKNLQTFKSFINEAASIEKGPDGMYHPQTVGELRELMEELVNERGNEGDFNDIDTSAITEGVCLIFHSDNLYRKVLKKFKNFNGDISKWDVSNVTDMSDMFYGMANFNGDISKWNVSKVRNMHSMFAFADSFNQPIGNWNVSNTEDMSHMFIGTGSFNQDISEWDVSNVTDMSWMFKGAKSFNQPIGNWNVSNVKDISYMFSDTTLFNQDISNWDVYKVKSMERMFLNAESFNQPIGNWNVSNVKDISYMFNGATSFNQDISKWTLNIKIDKDDYDDIFSECPIKSEYKFSRLGSGSKSKKLPLTKANFDELFELSSAFYGTYKEESNPKVIVGTDSKEAFDFLIKTFDGNKKLLKDLNIEGTYVYDPDNEDEIHDVDEKEYHFEFYWPETTFNEYKYDKEWQKEFIEETIKKYLA